MYPECRWLFVYVAAFTTVAGCRHDSEQHHLDEAIHLNVIKNSVIQFHKTHARFPQSLSSTEFSEYLDEVGLNDAWGNELTFIEQADEFEIYSHGPDGNLGTDDDMVVSGSCTSGRGG